ncbi:MAG: hypothetical protein ABL877_10965 [Thiobacillus sp.]
MIYQHITGRRPISLEAAQAYALGFNCHIEEISQRLADEARKTLAISARPTDSTLTTASTKHADLIAAWDLLLPDEQSALMEDIQRKAAHNKAVMEMHTAKRSALSTPTTDTYTPPDRRKGLAFYGAEERRRGKKTQ